MKLSRRKFLLGAGVVGGGLVLGISLRNPGPVPGLREGTFRPNAFLQITPDNEVIFQVAKPDMGQAVYSTQTTLIGEELDVDPARISSEMAGVHPDFAMGLGQMAAGSGTTPSTWIPVREAGAAARAMLMHAAANRWGIDVEQVATRNGVLINQANGEELLYGDVVEEAKAVGEDVAFTLKAPADYKWIGKPLPRIDSFVKSTGKAEYGIDVVLPGLKTAIVIRPPQFGGSLAAWNAEVIREQPGVHKAFMIHSGIAIVADSYWQARKAEKALKVEWNKGPLAGLDSAAILAEHKRAFNEDEAHTVTDEGDFAAVVAQASIVHEANYTVPFVPHSTMEPQNATALIEGERCEVWAPTQGPDFAQTVAAYYSGLKKANIKVNTTFLGGGFGRRAHLDFIGEVIAIAQQIEGTPVKLIWSREDDLRHDYYRPANYHGLKAGLNEQGELTAWQHKVVCSSIMSSMVPSMMSTMLPGIVPVKTGHSIGELVGEVVAKRDPTMSEGCDIPYSVENLHVSQVLSEQGIPVGFWRSVGSSHTAFASESFMDEMAHAAGVDPYEFRRQYLKHQPRHLGVLEVAAYQADWGNTKEGVYQGIAVHMCFNSYVAMVVEVSVSGKQFTVERVVAAADCGMPINPDVIRAQVESAIIYGLSSAIKDPITIEDGAVKQSNFHDSPVVRINEIPVMEVHVMNSKESPTGIGEPGLPPLPPALANALFAATGQRLRELPLKLA